MDILVLVLPALLISLNALGAQQVYAQTTALRIDFGLEPVHFGRGRGCQDGRALV